MSPTDILAYGFLFAAIYTEVFLLITFLSEKSKINADLAPVFLSSYPTVTIVVPCFNEETTIEGTLTSLLGLDYPKDKLEIIAVDDGSKDGTWSVMQRYQGHPQIKVHQKENGGKYTAINYGIKHSTADLIGCLDADSFVAPDTLKKIAAKFEDPDTMAVTPAIRIHNPKTAVQYVQNIEYAMGIVLKKLFGILGAIHVTPGPFSIFRRSVFAKVGMFKHAHNTEDMEMAMRLHANHLKIENCHNAWVYTVSPPSFKTLYKQRVRWTHGFFENFLDYKHLFLNKKYGNLAFFTLPAAGVSILGFLLLLGVSATNLVYAASDKIVEIQTVGFHPRFDLSFNWFYVNTSTRMFLILTIYVIVFVFMLIGKKLTENRFSISRDMLYYFLLYPIIAPFWILKSLYNTVLKRKTSWR